MNGTGPLHFDAIRTNVTQNIRKLDKRINEQTMEKNCVGRPNALPNYAQYSGAGIYKFTNKINGKIYVGQSKNVYNRLRVHFKLRGDSVFTRALKKYGIDNFDFQLIERVNDLALLDQREQHYMDLFQCYIPEKGYNVAVVASNPSKGRKRNPSEMVNSQKAIKKIRDENGHWWLGKKHTEPTKQKLSNDRKGQKQNPNSLAAVQKARRKQVLQISIETGQVLRTWEYVGEIADELGYCRISLYGACRGGRYSKRDNLIYFKDGKYKGFKWQYAI